MAQDNLGPLERLISLVTGLGLAVAAVKRRAAYGSGVMSTAGVFLIARGAAGYCPVKGALAGDLSLKDGLRRQWSRVRSGAAREIAQLMRPLR